MRVIVTGSQTWAGALAERRIREVLETIQQIAYYTDSPLTLVHGDAEGADTITDRWARRNDIAVETHPVDWTTGGRGVGFFRNSHMANLGGDLCVAFLRDNSPGTTDMIAKAKAAGIFTMIIRWDLL